MENKLCLICSLNCKGTSDDLNKLRDNLNFRNFLAALGEDNWNGLNDSLIGLLGGGDNYGGGFTVCGGCKGIILEAMEWRGRVVEVEGRVRGLQGELLGELGRLEECLGEYGGKLRRIRGNLKMEVVQLKFNEEEDNYFLEGFGVEPVLGEEHKGILGQMGRKMDGVVADLDKFQDNLASKFDDKRIKKRLKSSRKKFKSAELIDDSDVDDNELINQDNPEDNPTPDYYADFDINDHDDDNQDSDWSPPDETQSPPPTNQKAGSSRPTNQKRSGGKHTFRNQVIRLILNRAKRFASFDQPSTPVDLKYPIHYDPTLDKITIGGTTQILIIKDKCKINHLQCTLCDYLTPNYSKNRKPSYTSVECIYDHVIKCHYGGYNCEICGTVGPSRKKFLEHLRIHKEPEQFTCEICGRPCRTRESIKMHRFTHFNEEEKKREVEMGRATWWQRGKLEEEESGNFECETCGKIFKTKGYLRKHEGVHRNVVICPMCGKSVTRNWYRKYHSVYKCPLDGGVGEGGKGEGGRKVCWECGRSCIDLFTLKKHMKRMHSREAIERSWICDKCGKGYKSRGDLKTHEKVHGEVKEEWRCGGCGREFNQKKNLKRHKCGGGKGEGGSSLILGL